MRHLLTHTSGLGSYFNQKYMESSRLLFRELDDAVELIITALRLRTVEPD